MAFSFLTCSSLTTCFTLGTLANLFGFFPPRFGIDIALQRNHAVFDVIFHFFHSLFFAKAASRFFSMPLSISLSTELAVLSSPVGWTVISFATTCEDAIDLIDSACALSASEVVVPFSVPTPLSRSWLTLTSFSPAQSRELRIWFETSGAFCSVFEYPNAHHYQCSDNLFQSHGSPLGRVRAALPLGIRAHRAR